MAIFAKILLYLVKLKTIIRKSAILEKAELMKEEHLDEIDRRILRTLMNDARISNQKLSEAISLSPTPCWNRVRA